MIDYVPGGLLLPWFIRALRWTKDSRLLIGYAIRRRFGKEGLDLYVVGFVMALAVVNWIPNPPAWAAWLVPLLCAYRLLDILVAGLLVVFGATSQAFAVNDPRHTLFLTLCNVFAIVLMFAVSDRWLAQAWPQGVRFLGAQSPMDFLYMSWTNFTTLGNNFTPSTWWAEVLNLAEVTTSVLLLTMIVAVILGSINPTVQRGS